MTKRDFKVVLLEAIGAELDVPLAGVGFARKEGSSDYVRKCTDGSQFLAMYFEFRPKHHPGADSFIYPQTGASFPALNPIATQMLGSNRSAADPGDITFSEPIDLAIPREHQVRWYTFGRDTVVERVTSIRKAMEAWVIPFLDEYTTISSLTAAYEHHDQRFIWHRNFSVQIAAAYVLLGEPEKAMGVLEAVFRRPGAKRKYAEAFEYLARGQKSRV